MWSLYSAGIAVGFYGNGETCDGVNRLTYSLRHANRTIAGVQKLVRLPQAFTFIIPLVFISTCYNINLSVVLCLQVSDSASSLNLTADENLQHLESQYTDRPDYLSIVQKLQGQLDELLKQMVEIPFWSNPSISLEVLAVKIELYDWYR